MGFKSEKLTFKNAEGHLLDARLELPNDQEVTSYAIFLHCFTCSKNIHAATRISRALTKVGISVLRFDFTGLGNSEGDFSNTNFSSTVSDIICVYKQMLHLEKVPEILIGHSLGGSTALAAACSMPTLKAVITINAPSEIQHIQELFKNKLEAIERDGEAEVTLAGRSFIIRKQFLNDIRSIKLENKISKFNSAFLIFHSPQDEIVSIDHAQAIFEAAKSPKSLITLEGASHLLNKKEDSEYVSRIISAWGFRYLREEKHLKKEETSQLMSDEEKLDEAILESFPASDPLGFRSKSAIDKNMQ
ncbi:MAG: alpha/beta hydrolase [Bacteriovoracia bacterium]